MIGQGRSAWMGSLSLLVLTLGDNPPKADPIAMCRPSTEGDACACSMSSIEAPLSFGEAASLIVTFDRIDPGEHNEQLLVGLFRQCRSSGLPAMIEAPAVSAGAPPR